MSHSHSHRPISGSSTLRRLLAGLAVSMAISGGLSQPAHAALSIGISVNVAPPELPVYEQPPPPAEGYIWTPGYWAWEEGDYYWIPGTWVMAPQPGFLWTPGYWGWADSGYAWYPGYWGRHVGFYGGVNYGYGYTGDGYHGGYWRGRDFYYNRAVNNVRNVHIANVYNRTVINNVTVNRVSYNGGNGGIGARPSQHDLNAQREHHLGFTPAQNRHQRDAFGDQQLRASVNGGRPPIAATQKPGVFSGKGVMPARDANRGSAGSLPGGNGGPQNGGSPQNGRFDRTERPSNPGQHLGQQPGAGNSAQTHIDRPPVERQPQMRNDRPPNAGFQQPGMNRPEINRPQTTAPAFAHPPITGTGQNGNAQRERQNNANQAAPHAAPFARPGQSRPGFNGAGPGGAGGGQSVERVQSERPQNMRQNFNDRPVNRPGNDRPPGNPAGNGGGAPNATRTPPRVQQEAPRPMPQQQMPRQQMPQQQGRPPMERQPRQEDGHREGQRDR